MVLKAFTSSHTTPPAISGSSSWWRAGTRASDLGEALDESDSDPVAETKFPFRLMLEGATLEHRAGRLDLSLGILSHLATQMPLRVQPIAALTDLLRREKRWLELDRWLQYGVKNLPNASILQFEALKARRHGAPPGLSLATPLSDQAISSLSPELIWKFFLEAALTYVDCGSAEWGSVRRALVQAAQHAPRSVPAHQEPPHAHNQSLGILRGACGLQERGYMPSLVMCGQPGSVPPLVSDWRRRRLAGAPCSRPPGWKSAPGTSLRVRLFLRERFWLTN